MRHVRLLLPLLACLPAGLALAANGGTVNYRIGSGAEISTTVSGPYTFGTLTTPLRISFSDIGIGMGSFEDVFVFSVGAATLGSAVSGSQLNLNDFTGLPDITGLKLANLDTMTVFTGVASADGGLFSLPKMPIGAGSYALIVDGLVAPTRTSADGSSSAQFSGALILGPALAVPEPAMAWLLGLGLLSVAWLGHMRRKFATVRLC